MALFSAALALPTVTLAAVPMEAAIADTANAEMANPNDTMPQARTAIAPTALQANNEGNSAASLAAQSGAVDMAADDLQEEDLSQQDYATAGAAVGTVTVATARAPSHDVAAMAEEDMAESNGDEAMAVATAAPADNQQPASLNQQHSAADYKRLMQGEGNRGNDSPADLSAQPASNTLQKKVKGPHGELLATQPGEVQLQENRRFKTR